MKTKAIALIAALGLVVSLASCESQKETASSSKPETTSRFNYTSAHRAYAHKVSVL